jgi:L-malate glycosyltransferase
MAMNAASPVPVLLMTRELDQGGVERDVTKIAMSLDRRRFEPHVATYYAKGLRYEELRAARVPLLHVPLTSLRSMQAVQSAIKMRRYIKRHGIRIVHSYDASGVFCIPVARSMRVPVTISSQLSYREILDRHTQRLLRLTDGMADAVLVNCEAIRKYMIEHEQVPAARLELCYNGVVTKEFFPANTFLGDEKRKSPFAIGTVCALRPEKALTLLQEAFAMIRHLNFDMNLTIVGSGAQLPILQENAARLGIADASRFIPATRDVAALMRSMDIFVLPSYSEAFSNALLEAMACGCSVVGSRVGGTPELIGSTEERGLLFKSGDSTDLALKLSKLIADKDLRRRLATLATSFVRENLTMEIAAERTAAIYEKLLRRKTACHAKVA